MFDLSVSRRYYLYGMGFSTRFTFPEGIKSFVFKEEGSVCEEADYKILIQFF